MGLAELPEVVGYARVSSREQAENSAALAQQIARLEVFGAGLVLSDVESGREGKEDSRAQFQKLMGWVRNGLVKKVIITRLDRLSRSLPTLRRTLAEFQQSECILVALDDNIDLSTASGKFHVNMLGALAEMESDRLSERILRGKEHFRREKRASHPPFGYIVRNYRFEPDREPFLCLLSNQQEYSRADIARDLIEHYLLKQSLNKSCRYFAERYGYTEFWPTALRRWLTSPILQGDVVYFPKSKTPEIHPNTHESIMTREESRHIKEIIAFNSRVGGFGHKRGIYSLTGLVRCECGGGCIIANGSGGRHKYFICTKTRLGSCSRKKGIRLEALEQAVINALTVKAEAIAMFADIPTTPEEPLELRDLRQQLAALEELSSNSRTVSMAITEAMRKLRNQIEILQQQTQTDVEIDFGNRELLKLAASHPDFWAELDPPQKQQFFRTLVDHVLVSNGQILQVFLKL
ncbi:MAG: recombinase family protein [Synechococcales cyanobacterium C42_A2020_086]|jgi:DNA invertase Pin-like site-specific DNA recombinase|nr:recombinase family protein [Synechococcales cyanobacterium C42_A2020_086]